MAGFGFAADAVPDAGEVRLGGEVRFDGRAAGRELVEDGNVEIAVERERERARDGRGGEDENVRRAAVGGRFVHQALALKDAEAMLFVDGDETEAGELDVVFDEGVRADDELRFAGADAVESRGFFGGFQAADEELDAITAAFEYATGGKKMLHGENFRGSHERGLASVFDGDNRSLQGDDRFAAADVALEKTVHGRGLFEVGGDFGQDAFLGGGGLERENALKSFANVFFAEAEGDGVFLAGGAAVEREAELIEEKFFKDEALLRAGAEFVQGVDGFFGSGKVRLRQGLKPRRIAETGAQVFGQDVEHARVESLQRGIDGATNGARAEGADGFVDGNDAADFGGVDFLLRGGAIGFVGGEGMIDAAEEFDLRIDHLDARGAQFIDLGFAVKDEELALLEAAFEIATVKKFAGELAGRILHEEMIDGVASAHGAHGLATHDASANGVDAVGLDVANVGEVDAIFVAERQIVKKIVDRVDAALGEEFGAVRADAFDHADFGGQGEGHR